MIIAVTSRREPGRASSPNQPAEAFLEPVKGSGSAHGAFFSHHLEGLIKLERNKLH